MSDSNQDSAYGQGEASSSFQITAGEMLRQAREAQGLHIAALAVSLKVPVRKLEALEADRFDDLPDAVFVRALASSVCRALRIDPKPVLALLPARGRPLVSQHAGLNETIRSAPPASPPSATNLLTRPAVLIVLLILGGALVLWLLPSARLSSLMSREPPAAAIPVLPPGSTGSNPNETVLPSDGPRVMEPAQPAQPVASAATGSPQVARPATTPGAVIATAPAGNALIAPAVPPTPVTPASPSSLAALPAAPNAAAVSNLIFFTATGDSWVEVRDMRGVLTLQRTLKPGESVGVAGVPPLSVVVGRANATRVQVRGRDFDMTALARDNVARFQVK